MRAIRFLLVLVLSTCAIAQTKPADQSVIADFEVGTRLSLSLKGMSAKTSDGDAAQGQRYLRLSPGSPNAYVRLNMADGKAFVDREQLAVQVRLSAKERVNLTWMALDEKQQPIFLHRSFVDPSDQWKSLEAPLRQWRWPEGRAGDWDEVRGLALRIDSPGVEHLDVDDIRIERRAPANARTSWLLQLAFSKRDRKTAGGSDFLIATDATSAFSDQDLQHLLSDVTRSRKFIRRVFGDVVRPTEQISSPPMLLIFSSDADRRTFLERLGDAWGAKIHFGGAQGFTVQDIATTTYDAKLGVRRPVYLHEAVHAIVSRDLRLIPGGRQQGTVQEAIANYIQICVHPKSIPPDAYPKAFGQPIDGKGLLKPLETLFANRATSREYAQLAGLFAYLVEKDPELLRELAATLAEGGSMQDVLANRGSSFAALEESWLTWGRERFKTAPAAGDPIFEQPAEFR